MVSGVVGEYWNLAAIGRNEDTRLLRAFRTGALTRVLARVSA